MEKSYYERALRHTKQIKEKGKGPDKVEIKIKGASALYDYFRENLVKFFNGYYNKILSEDMRKNMGKKEAKEEYLSFRKKLKQIQPGDSLRLNLTYGISIYLKVKQTSKEDYTFTLFLTLAPPREPTKISHEVQVNYYLVPVAKALDAFLKHERTKEEIRENHVIVGPGI